MPRRPALRKNDLSEVVDALIARGLKIVAVEIEGGRARIVTSEEKGPSVSPDDALTAWEAKRAG